MKVIELIRMLETLIPRDADLNVVKKTKISETKQILEIEITLGVYATNG